MAGSVIVEHVVQTPRINIPCSERPFARSFQGFRQSFFERIQVADSQIAVRQPHGVTSMMFCVFGEELCRKRNLLLWVFDFRKQSRG